MPRPKRVSVISETPTGRNTKFVDNSSGTPMTRAQFVREINQGNYPNYYHRKINGLNTPVSKPDGIKSNNLD